MTIDTTTGNVLIDDNVFDFGNSFTYSYCIVTNSDATITNNYFSGVDGTADHILASTFNSTSGSINVSNNNFIRQSTTIAAYIDVSNVLYDCVITNNTFDQPTIDGTSDILVKVPVLSIGTLTPTITYHSNKNQTGYLPIQKFPYLMTNNASPSHNPSAYSNYQFSVGSYSPTLGMLVDVSGDYNTEGLAVTNPFPFNSSGVTKLTGSFEVQNGNTNVLITGHSPIMIPFSITGSGTFYGYIVFGNDNKYYQATFSYSSLLAPGLSEVDTIVLSTPYTGPENDNINADLWLLTGTISGPTPAFPSLINPLTGTFTLTPHSPIVTASVSQSSSLGAGSLISFGDSAASFPTVPGIYTIQNVSSDGLTITLTQNYLGSLPNSSLATSDTINTTLNFSFNLTELLPLNVQIINMIVGFWGNNNTSLISAAYLGFSYVSPQSINFGPSSLAGTMADVRNFATPSGPQLFNSLVISNAAGAISLANFNLASQYLVLTPSSSSAGFPSYFTTSQGTIIRFNLTEVVASQTSSGMFLMESPLIIKYRW